MIGSMESKQIDIPEDIFRQWQKTVDLLARIASVPAALIMRVHPNDIEVFRSSISKGNPYKIGETAPFDRTCGLYCETVIRTGKALYVPNALIDKDWDSNPDIKLNMISYYGIPILYPDKTPFGTICILDSNTIQYSQTVKDTLYQFREMIETHLYLIANNQLLENNIRLRIQTEKKLTESNNIKKLLLDVISHDLKNSAGVILGFSELLQEDNGDNEIVACIRDSSKNLIQIIDNVSTISKVTLGEKIELKLLDLVPVIEQVLKEYESQFTNKGMQISLDLPNSLKLRANPIIAEVFKNYLSNCLKYAADGKRVIINTALNKDKITINFIDHGAILPKEKSEIIFERGFQLGTEEKTGRGLGLAIVKRIAEAHNAEVGVKPNKPKGNIFYIRFPTN